MKYKKLYMVYTKVSRFDPAYVLAEHPTEAEEIVTTWLKNNDYGTSDNQKVVKIEVLAENYYCTLHGHVFMSKNEKLDDTSLRKRVKN